ncbi:TetR/AcrR family transcriptional regulator [Myxococcota bacterium]|nr:TetR/AcrR family transcriptional regulator [Myxococcota bacterium]
MPRPKRFSDDDVLDATRRAVLRHGPSTFTLADVAAEVGLARSTLIQRFESRAGLPRGLVARDTDRLPDGLAALPGGRGPQALWRFLRALVSVLRGERIGEYLSMVSAEMADPQLTVHARRGLAHIRDAIALRLPATTRAPEEIARHLQAVMQGASMQWAIEREGELSWFVATRLRCALAILFPDEEFDEPTDVRAAGERGGVP